MNALILLNWGVPFFIARKNHFSGLRSLGGICTHRDVNATLASKWGAGKVSCFDAQIELRKKPLTCTFIWRLIWGACAKGNAGLRKLAKAKVHRKSHERGFGTANLRKVRERCVKGSRKLRCSSPGVPPICTKWANRKVYLRASKQKNKAACTNSSLPHMKSINETPLALDILHYPFLREKGFVQPRVPQKLKLWSRKWCESSRECMLPV